MIAGVRVAAPAKVNLYLGVGARRDDGYHDVQTVLQAVDLHDEVEIHDASALSVTCAPDLGMPVERNLAYRAATDLAAELGRAPDVAIAVRKRIPSGAGLGGGSADAAAVLAGLAALWGLERSDPVLARVAAALGADVQFFLGAGGGTALFSGRGDVLVRSLPTPSLDLVLVKPPASISTPAAYAQFDREPRSPADPGPLLEALEIGDAPGVAAAVSNNLETAACALVHEVADALAWARRSSGVLGAAVSGSGSAIFAVCTDRRAAEIVARRAEGRGLWSYVATCLDRGVTVESMEA